MERTYYTRPANSDPRNSVDVFRVGKLNVFGEPWCEMAATTPEEAQRFIDNEKNRS